jgi:cell fate regulator YaaT (PSP1 superfamily)
MLVLVKLGHDDRAIYFNGYDLSINVGNNVIVDTEKGLQYGVVKSLKYDEFDNSLYRKVIRVATNDDVKRNSDNINDAVLALKKCCKLVQKYGLNMKIIDAYFTFMREQLIFRFASEDRVDFRNLAKELGAIYKTRIELRQIGIRDKARFVGGIGPCGRLLCCSTFLNEFASVSINMAKNQQLSLNPTKINGVCGRLLCCLNYENKYYLESKKNMPNVGSAIDTKYGECKVLSIDIFNNTIKVGNDEVGIIELDWEEYESKK